MWPTPGLLAIICLTPCRSSQIPPKIFFFCVLKKKNFFFLYPPHRSDIFKGFIYSLKPRDDPSKFAKKHETKIGITSFFHDHNLKKQKSQTSHFLLFLSSSNSILETRFHLSFEIMFMSSTLGKQNLPHTHLDEMSFASATSIKVQPIFSCISHHFYLIMFFFPPKKYFFFVITPLVFWAGK